jgi:ribosomal protein S14
MVKSKKFSIINSFKNPGNFKPNFVFSPLFYSKFLSDKKKILLYAYSRNKFFADRFKPTCLITGRQRGVLSKFFISRITFKRYAMDSQMSGFKKSRW